MMKNAYFTFDDIEAKSQQMLQDLERFVSGRRIGFVPERSALLILDMQRYFLDKASHAFVPSAPAVVPRIKRLAAAFTRRNS